MSGHAERRTPVVGVGAVIVRDDTVLIVQRAREPLQGVWTLPGGRVEWGESLTAALRREIREETGLEVQVGPVVEVFDRIECRDGHTSLHYVVIDYLCTHVSGTAEAADDAAAVAWVREDALAGYGVSTHARAVIRRALDMRARGVGHDHVDG